MIRSKRLYGALMLLAVLLSLLVLRTDVYGATEEDLDDPEYGRATGDIDEDFYSLEDGLTQYSWDSSQSTDASLRFGIDVSKYQGDMNWAQAKLSGVDFAFIRVGYRGLDSGTLNADSKYKANLQGAKNAGIPVGVYFFSQATTVQEAVEEANYAIELVQGYSISLPIVIDYEYGSENSGRLYAANLSADEATRIVNAFCSTVKCAGYSACVYANKNMLTNNLNAAAIAMDGNYIWLANYTTTTTYSGNFTFWQYSSKGDGATYGASSTYIDMDYWYYSSVEYMGTDYSAVFDATYYADHNPDLKAAFGYNVTALLNHFINYGMNEGRQAIADFDVDSYKNANADLRKAYGNNTMAYYLHYINYGRYENRETVGVDTVQDATTVLNGVDYSSVYDYYYYTDRYSDILAAFGNDDQAVLNHFLTYGMSEGRQAKSTFDVNSYKNANQDLRLAFGNDLKDYFTHYLTYGYKENRTTYGVSTVQDPITTWNGVDYSAVYDYDYYSGTYSDIKNYYGNDDIGTLEHFLVFGMNEGRQATATFNVYAYRANNSDLRAAFGDNLKSYFLHYMQYGINENRTAL